MKTGLGIALIAGCILMILPEADATDPVALVTDLKGNATITESGKNSRLSVLTYLTPGTEIMLEAGGRMVITFFSHPNEYTFAGPATVSIGQDSAQALKGQAPEPRRLADDKALAARKFAPLQRERTAMASFEMRGSARPQMRLLGPVNTEILSDAPEFSWTTLPGIGRYHWLLSESGGRTVAETNVEGGSFQLPKESPLRYGTNYSWKVDCKLPSGKNAWASGDFTLVDAARAQQINALRPAPDASFSDRLLFAVLLESEGLGFDAQAEWRILARERPDDPALRRWAEP
ncbi:MAG TPA: hypothetical protein VLR94_00575 [Acidobacteriota bacterium]|nr:hypothetical protein [Acidobacteriota bacterium]